MDIKVLGIDLAKKVFQLHGVNEVGKPVLTKKVARKDLLKIIVKLKHCTIAMEACGSCHYWAREFRKLGHEVKLIPAQHVKAFLKTNKNDANDAEAIVEASIRPSMRFVPVKELQHQDIQALHRCRERLVAEKVALINQIRGTFLEYGVLTPDSRKKMISGLSVLIEDNADQLTPISIELLKAGQAELRELADKIEKIELRLKSILKQNPVCQLLETIPGVGLMTATAVFGAVVDPSQFKNGRDFSAWLGLVPAQHSTGGKSRLLGISKRGNPYLRKLIVHGARSRVSMPVLQSQWMVEVEKRRGRNKAVVAQANKNARIIWAVMSSKQEYKARVA
jgi:transposase